VRECDDCDVVAAVLAGDVDAFSALVERYQSPVFNLMYRMTGSYEDARDLSQEAFVKVFEKLRSFDSRRKFFPWIYTIGLNIARSHLRKRRSLVSLRTGVSNSNSRDEEVVSPDESSTYAPHGDVAWALTQLSDGYREAVILYYREECSMQEIAQALGLSVSGAKMRVHRGLKRLRSLLGANTKGAGEIVEP